VATERTVGSVWRSLGIPSRFNPTFDTFRISVQQLKSVHEIKVSEKETDKSQWRNMGVRHGVSKKVEDGRRLPALWGGLPAGHRRVGHMQVLVIC
jgi:hypothetical protein